MKKDVFVLTTGGTIAHRSSADGVAVMGFDPQQLVSAIDVSDVNIHVVPVFQKGSMDVVPRDWQTIASAVGGAIESGATGVVVLHGTDTLHYTASALAFLLSGCGVPVVLTGSMIPGGDKDSDSLPNLRDAVTVAAYGDFAEVCVVFSADEERTKALIIRGCCARKVHSSAVDAFASINAPLIGTIKDRAISQISPSVRARARPRRCDVAVLNTNVALIKLTPNMTSEMLERFLSGVSGAVFEGTGVGHIRTDLQPIIEQFGKPAVVSTQAVYGGERLGIYDVDRKVLAIPNVIPAGNMSSETALVKLMWALGQGGDVYAIMRTNVVGELGPSR
jgi:glutamyl-tRNA(Gln) amidotransferase subunit D